MAEVSQLSGGEEDDRKLFVGEMLRAYLEQRGEAPLVVQVLRERATGRSRGFGFVTMVDSAAVERVLAASAQGELVLEGRRIEVKRAVTRHAIAHASRKLFVGGLAQEVRENDFRVYWSRFGGLVECVVMKDRVTGRSRGFGFVSFADDASVERALAHGPHSFAGRVVEVKVAEPKRPPPTAPANANVNANANLNLNANAGLSAYPVAPLSVAGAYPALFGGFPSAPVDPLQLHMYLQALMVAQAQVQAQLQQQSALHAPAYAPYLDATAHVYVPEPAEEAPEPAPVEEPAPAQSNTRVPSRRTSKQDQRHSSPAPQTRGQRKKSASETVEVPLPPPIPAAAPAPVAAAPAPTPSTAPAYVPPRVRLSGVHIKVSSASANANSSNAASTSPPAAAGDSKLDRSPGGSARSSRSSSRLPAPTSAAVAPGSSSSGSPPSDMPALGPGGVSSAPSAAARREQQLSKPRTHSSPARWRSDLVPWSSSAGSDASASETILKYFRSPTSSPGTTSPPSSSDTEGSQAMLLDEEYAPRGSRYSQYSHSSSQSHSHSHSHSLSDEQTALALLGQTKLHAYSANANANANANASAFGNL